MMNHRWVSTQQEQKVGENRFWCRGSDENALPLLHPWVDLLVRGVDEEVSLLVVLDERLHRLDGLAERPPLHLGLEPHVGDLQAEAVPAHADQAVVEFAQGTMSGRLSTERRLVVEEEVEEEEVEEAGGV